MDLHQIGPELGFSPIATLPLPKRIPQFFSFADLAITPQTAAFLSTYPQGIYGHQREGIAQIIAGRNVCLATSTSSGKSAVFFAGTIDHLSRNPAAKVLAIYPAKALGREQEDKWRDALSTAALEPAVSRIDGDVNIRLRNDLLRKSRVITATPDVLHSWLLSNLSQPVVKSFLKTLAVVIVDEVHTYTGVFGSNSAFFFRRFRHIQAQLGHHSQFICASATLADPAAHLRNLFGLEFEIVGDDRDTSPAYGTDLHLIIPPRKEDLLTETSKLLRHLATFPQDRFIAFVHSRKQAEQISSIVARPASGEADDPPEPDEVDEPKIPFDALKRLQGTSVSRGLRRR